MLERLETKATLADVGNGEIAGYASLFGAPPDSYRDIVQAGAFAATLARRMPMLAREHKDTAVGEWLDVAEDDLGLKVRGRFDLSTSSGRRSYEEVKAGALDGLSIGYVAKRARRQDGVRILEEIELHEISVVRRPASSRTRILSVKHKDTIMENQTEAAATTDATETKADDRLDRVLNAVEQIGTKVTGIETRLASEAKRIDGIEKKSNRPGATAETKTDAERETKAFDVFIRRGPERVETKDLTVSSDVAGGYLAPEQFIAEMLKNLVLYSPIRSVARVSQTTASQVVFPRRTSALTAAWVTETGARSESQPAYGQLRLSVHEAACYVDISNQLLEDSGVDMAAELSTDLAEEFGRLEGATFVSGAGVNSPVGFMANDDVAEVVSGAASSVTADSIISIYHELPTEYAMNGTWAMNRSTMSVMRKLKSGDGQYLLLPAGVNGAPAETLMGRPILECPDMDNVGAGLFPIAFGDFRQGYRIIDRLQLSVLRDPYTQQANGLVRFHARRRLAAGVAKAEAIKKLKVAAS